MQIARIDSSLFDVILSVSLCTSREESKKEEELCVTLKLRNAASRHNEIED